MTSLPLAQPQPPKTPIKAAEADRVPEEGVYPNEDTASCPSLESQIDGAISSGIQNCRW